MKKAWNLTKSPASSIAGLLLLCLFTLLALAGCKHSRHTFNPSLKQIDEMLDAQLPQGTSKARVAVYLSAQGFPVESTNDPRTMVATVRHVDTETLRPETARVTFHFDARDKLTTYELTAAPSSASQP